MNPVQAYLTGCNTELLVIDPSTQNLHQPPPDLAFDTLLLRTARWPGRTPHYRDKGCTGDQLTQTGQGIDAITFETAVLLRLDHHHAVGTDPLVAQLQQLRLDLVRQRRGANIKAQVNGIRHLVDVLAAGTLRTDCLLYTSRCV